MIPRLRISIAVLLLAACADRPPASPAPAPSSAGSNAVPSSAPASTTRPVDAASDRAPADTSPLVEPLREETPEQDPRSEQVTLKLFVQPVDAEVFWGRKRLGIAGRKALEIERPRNSGPLDVLVRASGFLPFHTRLHTDRPDTLTVRLISPQQARGLLGWKPQAVGTPAAPPRP